MDFRPPQLLRHTLTGQTGMSLNIATYLSHSETFSDIPPLSDASTAASAPPPSSSDCSLVEATLLPDSVTSPVDSS